MTINPSNTKVQTQPAPATRRVAKTTPFNAVTRKDYFGPKASRLQEEAQYRGYDSLEWATIKQWNGLKETIARGEKGTLMIHAEKKPGGTEESKKSFLYNRCQLASYIAQDTGDKPF